MYVRWKIYLSYSFGRIKRILLSQFYFYARECLKFRSSSTLIQCTDAFNVTIVTRFNSIAVKPMWLQTFVSINGYISFLLPPLLSISDPFVSRMDARWTYPVALKKFCKEEWNKTKYSFILKADRILRTITARSYKSFENPSNPIFPQDIHVLSLQRVPKILCYNFKARRERLISRSILLTVWLNTNHELLFRFKHFTIRINSDRNLKSTRSPLSITNRPTTFDYIEIQWDKRLQIEYLYQ